MKFLECYSKRLLNIYIIRLEGMWLAKVYGKYCDDNKMAYIDPDKMKCQRRCEQDANCIGISYTYNDTFDFLCYLCFEDSLWDDRFGFNFYRKPGM